MKTFYLMFKKASFIVCKLLQANKAQGLKIG